MIIRGTTRWFKATGKPSPAYQNTHNEWSFDLYVEDETAKRLKKEGVNVKDKGEGPFVTLKRKEFNNEGKPNQPIRIVDSDGTTVLQDRDTPFKGAKIGNGSTLNVNCNLFEYSKGKNTLVPLSIQVWDLVPYEGGEFQANPSATPTRSADDEGNWEEDAA